MEEMLWPLRIRHAIPTNPREELRSLLGSDGSLRVWIPGNLRERPEIGHYTINIGPERAREFRERIEDVRLWDIPDVQEYYPEQPSVSVMAGAWSGAHRLLMWPIDELPDELLPILDAFHRLVDEASASPREVLTGSARWSAADFSAREPLRLEFTLQSKGTERIVFWDPMAAPEGFVPVNLLVSQVKPADVANRQWIDITPDLLARPDAAKPYDRPPPGTLLELASGQSARFVATPSAYLSPGEYQAVLRLEAGPEGEAIDNFVHGVLALELPPLRIVHR